MASIIETSRCFLRPTVQEDRQDIYALYSSKDVRRFLGGTIGKKAFNGRFDSLLQDPDAVHWTIRSKENGTFIGTASIDQHHDGQDHEVSYQLLPAFWGKGFAAEVIKAVIKHASNVMSLPSIVAETQHANEPSRKLLEKLEMKPVKTITRFGEQQVIYRKDFP